MATFSSVFPTRELSCRGRRSRGLVVGVAALAVVAGLLVGCSAPSGDENTAAAAVASSEPPSVPYATGTYRAKAWTGELSTLEIHESTPQAVVFSYTFESLTKPAARLTLSRVRARAQGNKMVAAPDGCFVELAQTADAYHTITMNTRQCAHDVALGRGSSAFEFRLAGVGVPFEGAYLSGDRKTVLSVANLSAPLSTSPEKSYILFWQGGKGSKLQVDRTQNPYVTTSDVSMTAGAAKTSFAGPDCTLAVRFDATGGHVAQVGSCNSTFSSGTNADANLNVAGDYTAF